MPRENWGKTRTLEVADLQNQLAKVRAHDQALFPDGEFFNMVSERGRDFFYYAGRGDEAEPRLTVVSFGFEFLQMPPTSTFEEPDDDSRAQGVYAQVFFGSGGSTQQIDVDWAQGSQIVVPAQNILVRWNVDDLQALFGDFDDVPYIPITGQFSVQIARGAAPTAQGSRTIFINQDEIEPGESVVVRIPPFASRVWPLGRVAQLLNLGVTMQLLTDPEGDGILVEQATAVMHANPSTFGLGMKIPHGASFVRILNGSIVELNRLSLCFQLYY